MRNFALEHAFYLPSPHPATHSALSTVGSVDTLREVSHWALRLMQDVAPARFTNRNAP